MIRFSKEKVLLLHKIMAEATGGSVGLRDEGLLDAALDNAFAGFGEHEFYPTKEEEKNSGTVDGAKVETEIVEAPAYRTFNA